MGLYKQGLGLPDPNSAENTSIRDVIGNKLDDDRGNSLYARLDELYDNFQSERYVYPDLGPGATVVSAALNWVYGNYATLLPANAIPFPFHILAISIESCDQNAVFQLELSKGAADEIITSVRFAIAGGFFGNQVYVIGSNEVEANSRVRLRLASSNGGAFIATITASAVYFQHD